MIRQTVARTIAAAIVAGACAHALQAQQPPAAAQDPSADLIRQAEQAMRDGKEQDAVASARKAVAASPKSYQAHTALGSMLDLAGEYKQAREAFTKAGEVAATPDHKARAQRALAISYGFERDCTNAATIEDALYRQYLASGDFNTAGEVANELARLCLDAGNVDYAEQWYRKGTEAGLKEPNIAAERKDLWQYRLEHALGRIAARRGRRAEADRHVAAAKALLDRGRMPAQQKEFFPYLQGYVALFTGDYGGALTHLQEANQEDAYVLGLIAQSYEKLGQVDKAREYYRKVMAATAHNAATAGARPLARMKVR